MESYALTAAAMRRVVRAVRTVEASPRGLFPRVVRPSDVTPGRDPVMLLDVTSATATGGLYPAQVQVYGSSAATTANLCSCWAFDPTGTALTTGYYFGRALSVNASDGTIIYAVEGKASGSAFTPSAVSGTGGGGFSVPNTGLGTYTRVTGAGVTLSNAGKYLLYLAYPQDAAIEVVCTSGNYVDFYLYLSTSTFGFNDPLYHYKSDVVTAITLVYPVASPMLVTVTSPPVTWAMYCVGANVPSGCAATLFNAPYAVQIA